MQRSISGRSMGTVVRVPEKANGDVLDGTKAMSPRQDSMNRYKFRPEKLILFLISISWGGFGLFGLVALYLFWRGFGSTQFNNPLLCSLLGFTIITALIASVRINVIVFTKSNDMRFLKLTQVFIWLLMGNVLLLVLYQVREIGSTNVFLVSGFLLMLGLVVTKILRHAGTYP